MPASSEAILASLTRVVDPCCRERGISVVDMGLIEDVVVDADGEARVAIVLTSGWCPFQVDLLDDIRAAVAAVPGVEEAQVTITLDAAWSMQRLSESARRKLRSLPEPSEVADRAAFVAAATIRTESS
jgi:metal-sulfur cluster biosynthetic enzyme